jgi:hypothetical protein
VSKPRITYRNIDQYKYELLADYQIQTKIKPESGIHHPYFTLTMGGLLTVKAGYMWNGANWPAINTKSFRRGSLVHDVFAQMMRLGLLDYKICFKPANEELARICLEDGMWSVRTKWVYWAVSLSNDWCAPNKLDRPEYKVLVAP